MFPVDIIPEKKINDWECAEDLEYKKAGDKTYEVKKCEYAKAGNELHIVDNANDLKIIHMQMMIHQFKGFGNMKAIGDDYFRAVFFDRYDHFMPVFDGIYFFTIHHQPDVEKAQQQLLFAGDDDIITFWLGDRKLF